MKETDYAGIDYSGPGSTVNRDAETGIRYGMISMNSLDHWSVSEIYENGEDLGFAEMQSEVKGGLASAIEKAVEDYGSIDPRKAEEIAQDILDNGDIEWGDAQEAGPFAWLEDGYSVQTTSDNNLWVFKSPYYTYAQFCSPCVPGAGNLDTFCADGPRAYCLGHDWFEGGIAPYPVYRVDDDALVEPPVKE